MMEMILILVFHQHLVSTAILLVVMKNQVAEAVMTVTNEKYILILRLHGGLKEPHFHKNYLL